MKVDLRFCENREIPEVVRLLVQAFEKVPARYFERKLTQPDVKTLAVFENSTPVSTLTLYERKVLFHGEAVDMCGIGDVATLPSKRGRGYASRLMETAVDFIRKHNYEFSILFTDINKFYERFGYRTVRRLFSKFKPSECELPAPESVRFVKFDSPDFLELRNLAQMIELYSRFSSNFDFPTVRDLDYFRRNLGWAFEDGAEGLLVMRESKLVGYNIYKKVSDRVVQVIDFAADNGFWTYTLCPLNASEAIVPLELGLLPEWGVKYETFEDSGMMVWSSEKGIGMEDLSPYFSLLDAF